MRVPQPEDMFVCDVEERDISCPPAWKKLKKSQCTPLFMNAYTMRGKSLQCIHLPVTLFLKMKYMMLCLCPGPIHVVPRDKPQIGNSKK